MPTLTGGINTALSAVLAHTHAIQVINQNVANANTPGYRRQSDVMVSAYPIGIESDFPGNLPGALGTGVQVSFIQRYANGMLDTRFRAASGETQNWQARQSVMTQVETLMTPLDDSGLPTQLDQFWAAWGQLASDPTNLTLRNSLLTQAGDLANTFNLQANKLNQLRMDQNSSISGEVDQINTAASQIADLNGEIAQSLAMGQQPNDLMDKRDLLLDQLAESTGAVSFLQKDGSALVSIGGHTLVTNKTSFALKTVIDNTPANAGLLQVQWADDSTALDAPTGTLNGILSARDKTIPDQLSWLNSLASDLAREVNTLHSTGLALDGVTNGGQFFTLSGTPGQEAASLQVRGSLTAAGIAAGTTGQPGDNSVADAISKLKGKTGLVTGSNLTFNDFLNDRIGALATDLKHANSSVTHNSLLVEAFTTQRSSESGVSLDEEAANLAKYERAYQAAGRLMTAFDQMMDTIINGMGLVGRG